jgi:hypothetical protein
VRSDAVKKVSALVIVAALVWFIFGVFTLAHGSTSQDPEPHVNPFGLSDYTNPNAYVLGFKYDGYTDKALTVIQIRPYNTVLVHDEMLVFCGDVTSRFTGKTGTLAITYHRVAHRLVGNLACHDLVSVFEISEASEVQP